MNKLNPDLTCSFLGLTLKNPLVLASGILGTSPELLERMARCGAGAVTSKSCGPTPRTGHANPIALAWEGGVINAVGLTNPGAVEEVPMLIEAKSRLHALGVPLIASIFAPTVAQYEEVATEISKAEPDLIEVNISCPNVGDEFGTPFSGSPDATASVTSAVKRATHIPISVKLSPNVPDIGRIAAAAVSAGADAITAVNTMPGMLIEARAGQPVLANRVGGLSGWSLKPIALRCVAEISRAVKIPIIGTGGVTSGQDAAEMIMAGATAVGVGSAVWQRGPQVFNQIVKELAEFMENEQYIELAAMRGIINR